MNEIEIPLTTIRQIINEFSITKLDAIKIDIEGFEDKALADFFETCDASLYPKVIVLEENETTWSVDILSILVNAGYRRTAKTRGNSIFERSA